MKIQFVSSEYVFGIKVKYSINRKIKIKEKHLYKADKQQQQPKRLKDA